MSLVVEGGFVTHEINKVSWFVKFPSHWNLVPAKRLFPESKERAQESDEQLSATQEYGVIPQSEFMRLAGRRVVQLLSNIELRKRVEVDDFVISMRSFQGGLERAWACGGIRSSYVVLRPVESVFVGYYQFLFKSDVYIQALQSTANFIRDGQDMNYQNFVLIDLPYPPYEEQRQIAAFLQYEITKIDALIAEQEKLIALLKEKRQAVISHAVTKGLNPDAPMKDSGVEWLGEVPEHWKVASLRWFINIASGDGLPNTNFESEANQENAYRVIGGNGTMGFTKYINTTQIAFAVGRVGALCGNVHLIDEPCWITDNALKISYWSQFDSKYLYFLLTAAKLNEYANRSAQPLITGEQVKSLKIVIPPSQEQIQIGEYINIELNRFALLVEEAEYAIQLMQERRIALISAAVTGKIDVRGWQPPAA